jgi:hypothetical protein
MGGDVIVYPTQHDPQCDGENAVVGDDDVTLNFLMMSRSNESPSTNSGHGSTIQWPYSGATSASSRRALTSSSMALAETLSSCAAALR